MFKRIVMACFIFSVYYISESKADNDPEDKTIIQASWSAELSGSEWSEITKKAINSSGKDLIVSTPSDIGRYCPNYSELNNDEKNLFWIGLISKLSELESNHNPDAKYTESFVDNNENLVVSRGLLQLSIESSNGYGCGFNNEKELHNPKKNLSCGVVIMNKWIGIVDKVIAAKIGGKWKGAARYWSPFRSKNKLLEIVKYTSTIAICKTAIQE